MSSIVSPTAPISLAVANGITAHTVAPPAELVSLANSGWIVTVGVSVATLTKSDKKRSAEYSSAAGAHYSNAAEVKHNLLGDCIELRNVLLMRQAVDNFLTKTPVTQPWDGKRRYLIHTNRAVFDSRVDEIEAEFNRRVDVLLDVYEERVNTAAMTRGALFERHHYPTKAELRSSYRFRRLIENVPVHDYRNAISQQQADDDHKHYTREVTRIAGAIVGQQAEQLIGVLDSLSKGLGDHTTVNADGSQKVSKGRIVQTTYTKALQLCDSIAACNPTNNTALADARNRLAIALTDAKGEYLPIEVLKQSDSRRDSIKQEIDSILSAFKPVAPVADEDEEY